MANEDRLEELRRRNAEAEQGGGPERISRQHEAGKLACNGSYHFVSLFPSGHHPPEPTAQPDLRLPGNLPDRLW